MKSSIADLDIMPYCFHDIKNKVTERKNFIGTFFKQRDI